MASLIATNGPTALAMSLAPCAKLSSAAENTSGNVNSELMLALERSIFNDALVIMDLITN
jgi:hypothetical protein